ncbi:MAG TPA: helix-turn-helix domain-containing protein [Xanthobacteraceae bacterium]|nr:helix-turn-helix domain-containing protein [Xanthobacteraceae bacterium]
MRKAKPEAKASRQPFAELPPSLDVKKIGRPSKYDPSFCDLVLELGAAGKSKTQIAAALGVVRATLDNWADQHPEFLAALKAAKELELAWWETAGQINMSRQGFNATAFIFQMKNRFPSDYKDRQEVGGDPDNPIHLLMSSLDGLTRGVPTRQGPAE